MDETAVQLMEADKYLLDASALRLLPALAAALDERSLRILVSQSLHDALTTSDASRSTALVAALSGSRGRNREAQGNAIIDAYASIQRQGRVVVVDDEESRLVLDAGHQSGMLADAPMVRSQAHESEVRRIAAVNAATILEHSAATGTPILMKNRSLPRSLRGRVTVIEIADQVESLIERKQALSARLFGRRHTRTVKFFVGAVISVGGIWVPVFGIAGAVFALVDP